jgi:hypothetical protein
LVQSLLYPCHWQLPMTKSIEQRPPWAANSRLLLNKLAVFYGTQRFITGCRGASFLCK